MPGSIRYALCAADVTAYLDLDGCSRLSHQVPPLLLAGTCQPQTLFTFCSFNRVSAVYDDLQGVYRGFSSISLSCSLAPLGPDTCIPCTVPLSWYSFQALPVM